MANAVARFVRSSSSAVILRLKISVEFCASGVSENVQEARPMSGMFRHPGLLADSQTVNNAT